MFEQLLSDLAERPVVQGISIIDLLDLPAPLGALLRRMMRVGAFPNRQLAEALEITSEQAEQVGRLLVDKGILLIDSDEDGLPSYRVYLAPVRRKVAPRNPLLSFDDE